MVGLKTLLYTVVLETNYSGYMSDSPKSRYLQKYRLKGPNAGDYNSVNLGCDVFVDSKYGQVWELWSKSLRST